MKIALIGSKKSGKDFLTDLLKKYKPQYRSIAWADSLKAFCNEIYPGIEKYNKPELKDDIIDEKWNTRKETPRDIWERVSREKAEEDDRFFHKITLKDIDSIIKDTKENIIVTDTRNIHEYEQLKNDGFICIYITRPDKPIFNGYDKRIKEFYKDIELTYSNESDGLDFIRMITILEENKGDNAISR